MRTRQSPKIDEFKKRDLPINYSNLAINSQGELVIRQTKKSLEERVIEGYGVIWGSRNDYCEKFVKGCFSKSIAELGPGSNSSFQIKFRDRHGKSCSLFAELTEDEVGLYFKTKPLDDVQWANDVIVQVRSGTLNNFSVGFKHIWDRVEWDDEDDSLVILEARLFEISVVDIPSDTLTYACRSAEETEYLQDEVEEFITSLPKSRHLEARNIFARCMLPLDSESPPEARVKAHETIKPEERTAVSDYQYLINELKNS